MQDDLRVLVEEYLPQLAYQIMSSGPRQMGSRDFANRQNHVHDDHTWWAGADAEQRLRYAGPTADSRVDHKEGYHYKAWHRDGVLKDEWYINFYNIQLVDIEGSDIEPPQIDDSEVRVIEVIKETNDSASFKTVRANTTKAKETGKENTLAVTAEAEFETTFSRSAEAGIGVASGKSEMTARFRSRIEAHTDNTWRTSDRMEDSVEKEYTILPFTTRVVTIREGNPKIRIKIPTKGVLDCGVQIDIRNASEQRFDYLDDVVKCWQGLVPGREFYSPWFGGGHAVPQAEIEKWVRPKLNLDIEVRGKRVRYSGLIDKETVIDGKEREYAAAKREYYKRG